MTSTHDAALQSLSPENPILKREFSYQRFVIQRSRSGTIWIWLAVLMVVPALLGSVVYSVATLLNLLPTLLFYELPTSFHAYPGVLILMVNLSLYPVVTLVTLGLSRGSIAREKEGHTWQILRVTTINNWQLVVGKWWASVKALNGDLVMVIILRVGLAAYYIGIIIPSLHVTLDGITAAPYALYFAAIAPLLILQAAFDALLTAAIGVIAAVPDEAAGTVTTSSVLMLRFALVIVIGVWFVQIMNTLRHSFTTALLIAIGGTIITGLLVIAALALGYYLLEQT